MVIIYFQEALSHACVFGIDDAHWIDAQSWAFLLDLSHERNAILVLASCPLKKIDHKPPAMKDLLNHPDTKVINLEGLTSTYMIQLACQKLDVDSIPQEIEEIIHKRSHGVPLWCEELLEIMLDLNYLEIISRKAILNATQVKKRSKTKANPDDRTKSGHEGHKSTKSASSRKTKLSGVEFGDIPIPDSVAGIVLARIDNMSASEQMTMKCAAIAGTTFKRTLLQAIIPNCNPHKLQQSLNVLADTGILECAAAAEQRRMSIVEPSRLNDMHEFHCSCLDRPMLYSRISSQKIQKSQSSFSTRSKQFLQRASTVVVTIGGCETLQFVHNYIQETVYYLWTESQRKKLHEKAAHFLELQAHRCKNCGEGPFTGGNQSILEHRKLPVGAGRPVIGRLIPVTAGMEEGSLSNDEDGRGLSLITTKSDEVKSDTKSHISAVESRQNQLAIQIEMKIKTHLDNIYLSNISTMDVEMLDCHCDEIISYVYPQLVRHWRAAGNIKNTITYLIEAGAAAAIIGNNMEALSLLQEAKNITEHSEHQVIKILERGRIYSLIGQVSFVLTYLFTIISIYCW